MIRVDSLTCRICSNPITGPCNQCGLFDRTVWNIKYSCVNNHVTLWKKASIYILFNIKTGSRFAQMIFSLRHRHKYKDLGSMIYSSLPCGGAREFKIKIEASRLHQIYISSKFQEAAQEKKNSKKFFKKWSSLPCCSRPGRFKEVGLYGRGRP